MTSRLPDEVLNNITPLLATLARAVADGLKLSEAQLATLVQNTGLTPESPLLEELFRWHTLLISLREDPSLENRFTIAEALKLRGLPPAPVQLALDLVSPYQLPTTLPKPELNAKVVITGIRFRNLPANQGVLIELEVQGASGYVEVDSDYIEVCPKQFAAEGTVIEVAVQPLNGGMLTPTLRLVTMDGTVELPLLAEWQPLAEKPEPILSPMPFAELTDLERDIRKASPGDTIRLKSGVYQLSRPLDIDKALSLIGESMDSTKIVCEAAGYVLRYSGDGLFQAEGIEFAHAGNHQAHVVVVDKGEVSLARCRFTGGVRNENSKNGGAGLRLGARVRGKVTECQAIENYWGIFLCGEAKVTLEKNDCQRNNQAGIAYYAAATGLARQNLCEFNAVAGIVVGEQSMPTLEENTCQHNGHSGIMYFGRASGAARKNNCCENGSYGIKLHEQASPTLEENTCQHNGHSGINYSGRSSGAARKNKCCDNKDHGIEVNDSAKPVIEENVCIENNLRGISYSGSAHGAARRNDCSRNSGNGIVVCGQAKPTLEHNTCHNNKRSGMNFLGMAAGLVRQNKCSYNNDHGIRVGEQASPTLEGNTCQQNVKSGIAYSGRAAGAARKNDCIENFTYGIEVGEQAQPTLERNLCQLNREADIQISPTAKPVLVANICGNRL